MKADVKGWIPHVLNPTCNLEKDNSLGTEWNYYQRLGRC